MEKALKSRPMTIHNTREPLHAARANLSRSTFTDVNLRESQFTNINLSGAKFEDINLSGATFTNVNLSHVQITDCDTTGMKIHGILVSDLLKAHEGTL